MEEQQEPHGVKNKGLLVTALVLGVLVVLVYNWHIGQVRDAGTGEKITMPVLKRTMAAGEDIEASDIEVRQVETHFKDTIGPDVILNTQPEALIGEVLSRPVQRGRMLRWDDILGRSPEPPPPVDPGTVAFQLPISARQSPGQMLRVGDRITVLGTVNVPGKPLTTYRILDGAKVISVGGVAPDRWTKRSGRPGRATYGSTLRSYRSIGIQVPRETEIPLHNVLAHVVGELRVNVLAHGDKPNYVGKRIRVAPELRDLKAPEERFNPLR